MASVFNQFNFKNNYYINSQHNYTDVKSTIGSSITNNNNLNIFNNVLVGKKTNNEINSHLVFIVII